MPGQEVGDPGLNRHGFLIGAVIVSMHHGIGSARQHTTAWQLNIVNYNKH